MNQTSIPEGHGRRPPIGSPLHQSPGWEPPYVLQQMQQHGGKDHNKTVRKVDPNAPLTERKDTSVHNLWPQPASPENADASLGEEHRVVPFKTRDEVAEL